MFYRKLIILAISVVALYGGYKSDYCQYWLSTYITAPNSAISFQMRKMSVEERKEFRYGGVYTLCKYMTQTFDTAKVNKDDILVLLPPNAFLKAHNVNSFPMPDPSEFYYLSHLKSVWTNSPDVKKATWTVWPVAKDKLSFVHITSDAQREEILDSFNKFKPSL